MDIRPDRAREKSRFQPTLLPRSQGKSYLTQNAFRLITASLIIPMVFLLQFFSGAYQSEFGSHSDEAAHFISGLLIYDYICSPTTSPRQFAEVFYAHFPKVGIGHWPPFFYLVQGVWFVVAGASRTSALILMGLLTSGVAILTCGLVRRHVDKFLSIPTGLLLISIPIVQRFSASIMTEILVAALSLTATIAYARYAVGQSRRFNSLLFGCLASAAILTKGSALFLAAIPPLTMVFDGRFERLRTFDFWLPAIVVATLCGPFYFLTINHQRNGMMHESFSIHFVLQAIPYYATEFVRTLGPAGTILLGTGLWTALIFRSNQINATSDAEDALFATLAALVIGVIGFCFLVPCGLENRHLIPAIPPSMVLSALGFMRLTQSFARRSLASILMIAIVLPLPLIRGILYSKSWGGYAPLVEVIFKIDQGPTPVCLIVADPRADGMFVSEAALLNRRPGMFALRASKLLAADKWDGRSYLPRFAEVDDVRRALESIGVDWIVVDWSLHNASDATHFGQIVNLVMNSSEKWEEFGHYDSLRNGRIVTSAIHVYRRKHSVSSMRQERDIVSAVLGVQGTKTNWIPKLTQ